MNSDDSPSSISLTTLGIPVSRQYWNSIVRTTLEYIQRASTDVTRTLKASIRKKVKIAGFRDPMKADIELRVRGLSDIGVLNSSVQMEILIAWLETNRDLEECVKRVLPPNDNKQPDDENRLVDSLEADTLVQKLIELMEKQLPHVRREDLRMMIHLLHATQPLREEDQLEKKTAQLHREEPSL